MKSLKFLVAAAMMMASATGFAQFANSGAASSSSNNGYVARSYDRFGVSYNSYKYTIDKENADDLGMTGIGAEWIHGFGLSSTTPIYIESGLKFIYAFKSDPQDDLEIYDKSYEYKIKHTMMNIAVPINLAYRFTLPGNSDVSITPFTGITLKYNIASKWKRTVDEEYYKKMGWKTDKEIEEHEYEKWYDNFDKKDVGDKKNTYKRFQFGWQIGAGLSYKALYLGLSYNIDFTEVTKKTKTSNFAATIGYNF